MKKLTEWLSRIITLILLVSMCVLVVVTFLQVFCRFVIKVPVSWSEEVARISFVWLILMGAAVCVRENSHLSLEIVTSLLSDRARSNMKIFVSTAICLVSLVVLTAGTSYVLRSVGKTTVTMPIPANCVYIAAPISAILMIIFSVENIFEEMKNRKGDGRS